ncbi:DUF6249 domain-containing protein [Chitinophaga sp. HK235]|uniref:DUF6249 domain-containing protein n=1 Tax=Chitinophaga sp. HK235 TaxID=2952571 RepID=UPI001BA93AE9|nr:DUF6249 domain-containing protein [Chitinophaga sp. HK235]
MQTTSAAFFIALSLAIFGISYYYFTTRHKERMAIIEKGLPADFFKGTVDFKPLILTLGIVCISIPLGFVAGLFSLPMFPTLGGFVFIFFMFLFTGLGLLLSYSLLKKLHERE